ncbi:MAG: Ig-like domain-containing protein [Eubacterium sp.]|nr:Ig-like domain-containing protein [Eubacterium sp.]
MKRWGKAVLMLLLLFAMAGAMKAGDAKAVATYKIKINKQCCTVTVYKYNGTKYKACKAFVCSPGYATPTGTFHLGEKMRWHTLDGPTYGQYCTRITGSILFHSVWYYQPQSNTQSYVQYNKLGTLASHGCVRLTVGDAKWIYDNVPSGTSVKIYNSDNPGPLGKPKAIKVKGYQGWDPTDPDSANPYLKKNPKIKGVKSREIEFGKSFDVKKGVTATNTTGFDATGRIKVKIYYRAVKTDDYQKVSKLDTSKAGTYKVVYSVKDEIGHKKKKTAIYTIKPSKLIKKITLNATKKTLYVGGKEDLATFVLKAKSISPSNASIKALEFSSEGTKIATIDEDGTVHAKKKGFVYLRATALDGSGVYSRCHITVEQLATKVEMKVPSTELNVGESMQLTVKVLPKDANNQTVTYSSSKPEVATVDENGNVTAIAPGKTKIKVKCKDKGKKSASVTLTVIDPEASDPVSGGAASVSGGAVSGSTVTTAQLTVFDLDLGETMDADSRVYRL